ncbi:unnamed protein product, partial [Amoebophrya sp. A120]|eukprot:GSA120T00007723001.1
MSASSGALAQLQQLDVSTAAARDLVFHLQTTAKKIDPTNPAQSRAFLEALKRLLTGLKWHLEQ